jgi:Ca2+-binding EF-hand superfamily protein
MSNSKLTIAISVLSLLGSVGVAAARDGRGGPKRDELRATFDRNQDGKLDDAERAEMMKAMQTRRAEHRQQMLAQFDSNRDGKLDDAEREKMIEQKSAEHFKKLDANGDGSVSYAEFKAARAAHHRRGFDGFPPFGPNGNQ